MSDLEPSMDGEEIVVIGRVVPDENDLVLVSSSRHSSSIEKEGSSLLKRGDAAAATTCKEKEKEDNEEEEEEEEESVESVARKKARKVLLERRNQPSTETHAQRMRQWEEHEMLLRQRDCWRTLPFLSKNQDRFRLAQDGHDVVLQFDSGHEDTFLPDNTELWIWGRLEVRRWQWQVGNFSFVT